MHGASLSIEISQLENHKGVVEINLFNKEKGFLDRKQAYKIARINANQKPLKYIFKSLPKGKYAFSAFHDENNNSKLDTYLGMIPKEPLCTVDNGKKSDMKPTFKQKSFLFKNKKTFECKMISIF